MQTFTEVAVETQEKPYDPRQVWEPIVSPEIVIEEGKIYFTSEYDAFGLFESNRKINEEKVIRLVEAMKEGNKPVIAPILVNEDLMVIDGQHRREAYKIGKKPLPFIVKAGLTEKDIPFYNNNLKNWTNADYLKSYADKGYPDYVALREYMVRHSVSQSTAMRFLTGQKDISRTIYNNKERSFENAEFKINTSYDPNEKKIANFTSVIEALEKASPKYAKNFVNRESFVIALMEFVSHKNYVHSKMLSGIKASGTSETQMNEFATISAINYKRKSSVYFAFLADVYNFGKHSTTSFS